ncbi:hypothetical protein LJR009_001599 [Bosea sp. LjRoot9]|uniref:hypothetical protein n=1 Tax=Bosea sp. LjRoot9 TaxID=3342341 RepID=UPI003ED02472
MSAFDALDAMNLRTSLVLFGRPATLHPMKPGASGVNAAAAPDTSRDTLTGVAVIRSEWSERVQIGGNGLPTPAGAFKLGAMGIRHIATVMVSGLPWTPAKGDELEYEDRPGLRYRMIEPMPDGLSGLHLGLSKV